MSRVRPPAPRIQLHNIPIVDEDMIDGLIRVKMSFLSGEDEDMDEE